MKLMADLTINGIGAVSHSWSPANDKCGAYGLLRFGDALRGMDVYLHDTAEVDAVIAELVALKQEMDPPAVRVLESGRTLAPGEPVRDDWCPGITFMEHEEVTLYCDRENGHAGSHHAPGPDEGSEVAWSDCDGGRDSAAASQQCVLHAGHDGSHRDAHGCEWTTAPADEDGPCMKVGCGHGYDDHSLDLESGDRLYCQRCECRRFLSATAMRAAS